MDYKKSAYAIAVLLVVLGSMLFIMPQENKDTEPAFIEKNVIRTSEGGQFSISLPSNPTTGYVWRAIFDDRHLTLVESSFVPPKDVRLVGAEGREVFVFRTLAKGETSVTLLYERPWEKENPAKQMVYMVKIK